MAGKNIKEEIEEFWGELFADNLKDHFGAVEVNIVEVDEDPPDVLYDISFKSSQKNRTWAEITNVYPSKDTAKQAFQAARAGLSEERKTHEAIDSAAKRALGGPSKAAGGALVNPDGQIAKIARKAILEKIRKTTYEGLCRKYGAGHLLLVIPYQTYPLVSDATAEYVKSCMPLPRLKQQSTFCSVWVGYKHPDVDDGLHIVHLPTSSSGYAFVLLWPDHVDSVS